MHDFLPIFNYYHLHSDIDDDRRYFHLLYIAVYTEHALPLKKTNYFVARIIRSKFTVAWKALQTTVILLASEMLCTQ